MKKIIGYGVPVLFLIIAITGMTMGGIFKQPFGTKDNVIKYMDAVEKNIEDSQWKQGKENLDQLKEAWKKTVKRVQFSVERDEINELDINIARLEGALMAKDQASAFIELSEARMHWRNLEE